MRAGSVLAILVATYAAAPRPAPAAAVDANKSSTPRESRVAVGRAELYAREVGQGRPLIVLHGGPDFDHTYLLPELDRLSDLFRLIYYDQRGRGRSAAGVQPEDVTLESDIADVDVVREHFALGSTGILGHSWGTGLALEYALHHPDRVSQLILLNPAPASKDDFLLFRKARAERMGGDLDRLKAMAATDGYQQGDPDAVAAYYRIHFKPAILRSEDFEKVIARLRASFTKEGILKARAVEARLMNDTWLASQYDLMPKLATLRIPTLVVHSDHDFIPEECAAHIARAIPHARLVDLKDCGHFSYLECPEALREAVLDFIPAKGR